MNGSPQYVMRLLRSRPQAAAEISGSEAYPDISGIARFYQTPMGVIVYAEITGLPKEDRVFGFHIHEGDSCGGADFSDAGGHYNPDGGAHPYHAGDLPPLFGNDGYALALFLTDRFSVSEVVGRTMIVHGSPDDFTTQPAGNSGERIACGIIKQLGRGRMM